MRKPVTNIGASLRQQLLNLAKERQQTLDLLLTRFVLERFLYRLSQSPHRDRFALKGAMLMTSWFDIPFRPTRDLDLLAFGDDEPDALVAVFRDVCATAGDDGVVFDPDSVAVEQVREQLEYGGARITANAVLSGASVRVLVDVGFGDAIEPGLEETELTVLLGLPAPRLRSYARETVIAEKFQALVMLGRANSRMKDFYDIWLLARTHDFAGDALPRAIAATFFRRKTAIPVSLPDALSADFAEDRAKQQQWASFAEGIELRPMPTLASVLEDLATFLMPHAQTALALQAGRSG